MSDERLPILTAILAGNPGISASMAVWKANCVLSKMRASGISTAQQHDDEEWNQPCKRCGGWPEESTQVLALDNDTIGYVLICKGCRFDPGPILASREEPTIGQMRKAWGRWNHRGVTTVTDDRLANWYLSMGVRAEIHD